MRKPLLIYVPAFYLSPMQSRQRHSCRVIAAHAMDPAAWRSRRRANEYIPRRGSVMPGCRPEEELPQIQDSARDVAACQVCIHALQIRRSKNLPGQDTFAKTWSKALNLRFYLFQHVYRRAVGHMAVSPYRMLALWCAGAVEQARLREQDERPFRGLPISHRRFRSRDFLESPA